MIENSTAINQVLQQMRSMAVQAGGQSAASSAANAAANPAGVNTANFASTLKNAVNDGNQLQQASSDIKACFEKGDPTVNLAQVKIDSAKANLTFTAVAQVRNKFIEAYQNIANMPI